MDISTTHWTRTDQADGATETLRLVRLTTGESFFCDVLDRRTPYLVQITTGPGPGDDLVGIYDLDGDEFHPPNRSEWELAEEAPDDVIEQIETVWASGLNTVTREVA